jgi:hypothetical protein
MDIKPNYPVTQTNLKHAKTFVWDGTNNAPFPTINIEKNTTKSGITTTEANVHNMPDSNGPLRITPNNVQIITFALEMYKME